MVHLIEDEFSLSRQNTGIIIRKGRKFHEYHLEFHLSERDFSQDQIH